MKNPENLEVLQRKMGYFFKNTSLLTQALTHKSARHKHNERLEFLGDSILNFLIADLLYQQFNTASEGDLTRARASLVKKGTLLEVAIEFSLGDHLHLGIGEQRSGGFRRGSILADALEALIAAIYLDAGFQTCQECIKRWYSSRLAKLNPDTQEKDPKTRLQEWLQANHKPLPKYQVVEISGEPHSQTFKVTCEIEGSVIVMEGTGSSRRFAEQAAAQKMLEFINHDKR